MHTNFPNEQEEIHIEGLEGLEGLDYIVITFDIDNSLATCSKGFRMARIVIENVPEDITYFPQVEITLLPYLSSAAGSFS